MSHTYAEWQTYLSRGRKKYERTLYDRGFRVQYANKYNRYGDIQIVVPWANNHPLITIHPDDTMTLEAGLVTTTWGGSWDMLRAYSVRFTIQRYADIEVVQRNFKFHLYELNGGLTPQKIQGCRTCKQSGKVDSWCHSPSCWNGNIIDNKFVCPDHPNAVQHNMHTKWHSLPCEHGIENQRGHTITKGQVCYYCNGTGKRDYGSKRISLLWDGSPLKVKDGNIVRKPLTDLERIVASYVGPTNTV